MKIARIFLGACSIMGVVVTGFVLPFSRNVPLPTRRVLTRVFMMDTGVVLPKEIPSTELLQKLKDNKVQDLVINEHLDKILAEGSEGEWTTTEAHPLIVNKIVERALDQGTGIDILKHQFSLGDLTGGLLQFVFMVPLFFLGINLVSTLFRNGNGAGNGLPGGNGMFPFGPNNVWDRNDKEILNKVTFEDWAGSPEVLRECSEIVSFLKDRSAYEAIGARVPKGILLEGPPGTGKTLLAKAIAGEAEAHFISLSGSEFVELYVGLGASRVRKLFKEARKNKPCILFIDEIDAVGRQRGAGINMGNDEREQTLNQLLAEMDGFQDNEDLIVIAATNRQDVLDTALLRPGRFDRIINVPLPDTASREKILRVHAKTKTLSPDVDLSALAVQTGGYSGAELQNLLNEAALISVRRGEKAITKKTLNEAIEKLMVGIQKEEETRSVETKRRVAIHEAGHAVLALAYPDYFDLQKVTIQNTYSGAGGYTIFTDKPELSEHGLYTKDYLKKRLRIALGGRAAESLYYGDDFVSIGAVEDLKQVNTLARKMISQFGMGEQIENFNSPFQEDNPFVGRMVGTGCQTSEELLSTVDREVMVLIKEAYHETKRVLKQKEPLMEQIIDGLLRTNTLLAEDLTL